MSLRTCKEIPFHSKTHSLFLKITLRGEGDVKIIIRLFSLPDYNKEEAFKVTLDLLMSHRGC